MTLQYYKSLPAIIEAVENGKEWEYTGGEHYYTPTDQSLDCLLRKIRNGMEVRLKPAPPAPRWWNCEADVPMEAEWFYVKRAESWERLTFIDRDGISLNGAFCSWFTVEEKELYWSPDRNRANLKPCQTEGGR